jgi:GntR family transcriptional repressor for pyruvate dehydrogenase complex
MKINFEPVERTTVSEEIAKKIINLVNSGSLLPGDKLPSERKLMDQLNVSRSPIREALRSLSLIGLLDTRPGDGTYVSEHLTPNLANQVDWSILMSKSDVLEWLEVREPLEIQAAALAAERATPEDLERLKAALAMYYDSTDDPKRLSEAEIQFHRTIVCIAGNMTLQQLMDIFYGFYRKYVQQQRFHFAVKDPRSQGHQEIVEAIRTGDTDAAREAMTRHLSVSKQRALAEELDQKHRIPDTD